MTGRHSRQAPCAFTCLREQGRTIAIEQPGESRLTSDEQGSVNARLPMPSFNFSSARSLATKQFTQDHLGWINDCSRC